MSSCPSTPQRNIARWCVEQIPNCYKAKVCESENNTALYSIDDNDAGL